MKIIGEMSRVELAAFICTQLEKFEIFLSKLKKN